MLDDRLTAAGLALREAPVPDTGLDDLVARRRRRTTRRVVAGGALLVAVALVGVVADRRDPQPVRVVDDGSRTVHVPPPRPLTQLLPRSIPASWRVSGIGGSSNSAGIDAPLRVYGRRAGVGFSASPYVAVLDLRAFTQVDFPSDQKVDVNGIPGYYADEVTGLRRLTFGAGRASVSVYAWRVDDIELARIARGIVLRPGSLTLTHLPPHFRRVDVGPSGWEPQRFPHTISWSTPDGSLALTSTASGVRRLERITWLWPGTTTVRRGGRTLARTVTPAGVDWRWLEDGAEQVLAVRPRNDDPRHVTPPSDAVALALITSLRPQPMPSSGPPLAAPDLVPYLDDRIDGRRYRLYAAFGFDSVDHTKVVCVGFDACVPPPVLGRALVARWITDPRPHLFQPDIDVITTFAVADEVAAVAVRYRGAATRVMTPVRLDRTFPRAVGVVQTRTRRVEAIEARDRRGRVISVLRSPLG